MICADHYRSGGLYGIRYTFETLDDGIPWHTHPEAEAHNVVCLRGRVAVYTDTLYRELDAGDIADLDCAQRHEIACLQPGSMILNLYLRGMPAGYDKLPESELHARIATKPLTPPEMRKP